MRILDALSTGYARRALVEAVLVGAVCGAVGVQVVLRKLSFFTMAMTHATFPGIVLAALLGVNLYLGSGLFGVVVVLAVGTLATRRGMDATTVTGVVLSAGFALGVLLLSAQDGFTRDLSAYLVGSILTVGTSDLVATGGLAAVVLLVLTALSKELVLGAFDRDGLVAAGYPALRLDVAVLLLIELTIVTSVPAVGTILAVALVVAPAATARLWCERVGTMTALSMVLGVVSGVVGLAVSVQANVAAGGAIVLVTAALFALSLVVAPRSGRVGRLWPGRPCHRMLRGAGLVGATRRGREVAYRLTDDHVAHIVRDAISHSEEVPT